LLFLNKAEIERNTRWLTENASAPVRYLAGKHLLKKDPRSKPIRELWHEVEECREAEEIFSTQKEDGSWFSGGPWGPLGYHRQSGRGYTVSRPKFVTTAWILPFLGEMGFTVADKRIQKSCEFMLQELQLQEQDPELQPQTANCCGLYAIPLRAFASVGMAADKRLRRAWKWLSLCQRPDGGWLNPNHLADSRTPSTTQGRWPWDRSCAWGSFYAAQAMYFAAREYSDRALQGALGFMRWHLLQQDPKRIQTWVYHGHNTVRELLMMSAARVDMRVRPISDLLLWLKGFYRAEEGVFRTQTTRIANFAHHVSAIIADYEKAYGSDYWQDIAKTSAPVLRYHLYHLVEDDWLTYYLTRIALNMAPEK
jgi:hypothetical protein